MTDKNRVSYWKNYVFLWNRSNSAGKLLLLLFIPEIIITIYIFFTNSTLIDKILFAYLLHGILLFQLNGKAMKEYLKKWEGKEKGGKLYNDLSGLLAYPTFDIKNSFLNPKLLLFVAITNPLEILGGFYASFSLLQGNVNNSLIIFWIIIVAVAVQDLLFFDYLKSRE
jgi:hypothetical protein